MVRRGSQSHQTPHVGFAQIAPWQQRRNASTTPTSIDASIRASHFQSPLKRKKIGADEGERQRQQRVPGGRHVHVHDPLHLAHELLGRRDEEAEVSADREQHDAGEDQRVCALRRRQVVGERIDHGADEAEEDRDQRACGDWEAEGNDRRADTDRRTSPRDRNRSPIAKSDGRRGCTDIGGA